MFFYILVAIISIYCYSHLSVWFPQGTCNMGGGGGVSGGASYRLAAEQQRDRLLQLQRSQQMLVSPEVCDLRASLWHLLR